MARTRYAYEQTGEAERAANRDAGDNVYYLLTDQVGSTSKTVNAATGATTELRDDACPLRSAPGVLREGEVRYTDGMTATDYTYTGQYSQMDDVGLMFDNARGKFGVAAEEPPSGACGAATADEEGGGSRGGCEQDYQLAEVRTKTVAEKVPQPQSFWQPCRRRQHPGLVLSRVA